MLSHPVPVGLYEPPAKRPRLVEPSADPFETFMSGEAGNLAMPRTRGYGRKVYRRKRRIRRKGRRRTRVTNMWPKMKLVRFRVVSPWSVTTGAGSIGVGAFKANGLNDPTGFAGAAYPLGLKEWAAMYKSYCVVASKCWVRAHNVSSTGSVMYGLTLLNNATSLTSYSHYLELPITRGKMLSPDVDHSALGLSFGAKRFYKVKKFMDADELHGTMTATPTATDPTDLAYYHLWVQDTYAPTEVCTLEGTVTLEYTCLLFDSTTPSRSV